MKEIATIKVEFMAGTLIDNAFAESIRLAKLLGCCIEFNFNSVTCFTNIDGKVETGVSSYNKALHNEKYKFASA